MSGGRFSGGFASSLSPSTNNKIKAWQVSVGLKARECWDGQPSKAPIALMLSFWRRRPRCHFGTGRNAKVLKSDAPIYSACPPDLDKLVRGMFDAMTGVVYVDDKQICQEESSKGYAQRSGVFVSIRELGAG